MASIAIDHPVRDVAGPRFGPSRRLRALLRLLRRRQAQRRLLAEVGDAHALADIGLAVARRTPLERWAAQVLDHRR